MNRIAFTLLGAFCCLGLYAQTAPNVLGCFVEDGSSTNVRNAPGGEVIRQLPAQGIYMLSICNPKDGWWQVFGGTIEEVDADAIELPEEAWIHSSVIGLSTRNYGGQQLSLRSDPREGAPVVGRITVPEDLVRPLDITEDGEWVKVRWGKVTGWIERKWLCGNPLSSCS